jgi:hypothetical protein
VVSPSYFKFIFKLRVKIVFEKFELCKSKFCFFKLDVNKKCCSVNNVINVVFVFSIYFALLLYAEGKYNSANGCCIEREPTTFFSRLNASQSTSVFLLTLISLLGLAR